MSIPSGNVLSGLRGKVYCRVNKHTPTLNREVQFVDTIAMGRTNYAYCNYQVVHNRIAGNIANSFVN
jgi:hypothetical protein